MKSAQDWLKEIEELYENQKQGKTEPNRAREMNQTIKTLIALTKVQLQYNKDKSTSANGVALVPLLEEAEKPK